MKLVKVVFAAALLLVSGSAMAAVGEYRETGEEVREGQLICPKLAESAYKRVGPSEIQHSQEKSREVASAHSAN